MKPTVESMRNTPPGYFSVRFGLPEYTDWGYPNGPQKAIRATVQPAPYKQDKRRTDLTQV
jgi:hypothetical protein